MLARRAYELGSSPASLLSVRMLIAAVALTGLTLGSRQPRVGPRDLGTGAAAGVAFAAAGLGEFEALARAPAPAVVLLVFVAPVWVALASWAAGRGPPGWLPACAIALILAGLALLVGVPGGSGPGAAAVGLALGASMMSAAFFMVMADLTTRVAPVRAACIAAWPAAIATFLLQPAGIASELSRGATTIPMAIGCLTACGLGLLAAGLRGTSALWASAVIGVEPLAAAVLSWFLLGEFLSGVQLAGAGGVLLGVTAMSVLTGPEPPARGAIDRTTQRRPGSPPPRRPARTARRHR